jgi:cell division inhibitor SepF
MGRIMQRMWHFLGFAEDESGDGSEPPAPRRAPVLNLHAPRAMEIVVLTPGAYDDAQVAADCLKAHRSIVVNLRTTQKDLGVRVVDFLSGVAYALDGHMHRVAEEIFLFTPHHVAIAAEHVREEPAPGSLFPLD